MTNDDRLASLGADWRRQQADLGRLRGLIERRHRRTQFMLALKTVGTAIALVAGGWFVWLALAGAPAIFALAGIVLLVALPLMLLELAATARSLRADGDETALGVLHRARAQAEMAQQLLWCGRIAAVLLAASAVGLLLLYAAGRAEAREALIYTPLWGGVALGGWLWQVRRGRRLGAEIARCDALLVELGATVGD